MKRRFTVLIEVELDAAPDCASRDAARLVQSEIESCLDGGDDDCRVIDITVMENNEAGARYSSQ